MPVPQLDPMPVPAPLWLLRTLLLLTFGLHLLFMNTLLGGSVVAFVCALRRRTSKHAAQLASDLAHILPPVFAFTITLGVAPLLFLQVLYGHLLYASSIVMAVPWLSVIGLVLCAYYGVYYFSFRGERNPVAGAVVLGVSILMLAAIAFIYTNNFTLMLSPDRWLGLYAHSPSGWILNLAEPSLLPRYLHFMLGAFAIAGLFLLVLGVRKRETSYGRWLIEQGSMLFMSLTIANYLVGFWFLLALPSQVRMIFMGRNTLATAALGLGFVLPLAAMMHLAMIKTGKAVLRNAVIAIVSGVLTVGVMVIMRDALRNAYLEPYFRLEQLHVAPQWGVIALFVVLFVCGLVTLTYMLRAVVLAKRQELPGAPAAESEVL